MKNKNSHIISSLTWNTTFDSKESAVELQQRLSGWTNTSMLREISQLFDKICPPDQTWKIESLDLYLGQTSYNDLESDLSTRLQKVLLARLMDLILYADKGGKEKIEILDHESSQLSMIEDFLRHGVMNWSYKSEYGSLNELVALQLHYNRNEFIGLIKSIGGASETIRKRIAWQFADENIKGIIKGIEPGHHDEIIEFSDELEEIQSKQKIVSANSTDFKKNVWFWVLNYLLTERGTIFNRISFLKSSIGQMANHYNVRYEDLFALIEQAIEVISQRTGIRTDFIHTLRLISIDELNKKTESAQSLVVAPDHWQEFNELLSAPEKRKDKTVQIQFNDLVLALHEENAETISAALASSLKNETDWVRLAEDLNDSSMEVLLSKPFESPVNNYIKAIYAALQHAKLDLNFKKIEAVTLQFLHGHRTKSLTIPTYLELIIPVLQKETQLSKEKLILVIASSATGENIVPLNIRKEAEAEYVKQLGSANPNEFSNYFLTGLNLAFTDFISGEANTYSFRKKIEIIGNLIRIWPDKTQELLQSISDQSELLVLVPYLFNASSTRNIIQAVKALIVSAIQNVYTDLKQRENAGTILAWLDNDFPEALFHWLLLLPTASDNELIRLAIGNAKQKLSSVDFKQLERALAVKTETKKETEPESDNRMDLGSDKTNQESSAWIHANLKNERISKWEAMQELKHLIQQGKFTPWLTNQKEEVKILLDLILPEGERIRKEIINSYRKRITENKSTKSEQLIIQHLNKLFWTELLSFQTHYGNTRLLKKAVETAVQKRLPDLLKHKKDAATEKNIEISDRKIIRTQTAIELIRKGIESGKSFIEHENESVSIEQLIEQFVLHQPAVLIELLVSIPVTSIHTEHIQQNISFRQFVQLTRSGKYKSLNSAMSFLHLMAELTEKTGGKASADKLKQQFLSDALDLLRSNRSFDLKALITGSFAYMAKESGLHAADILTEFEKSKIQPAILDELIRCYPAFLVLKENSVGEDTNSVNAILSEFKWAEEDIRLLLLQDRLIIQDSGTKSKTTAESLSILIQSQPEDVLLLLRSEVIPVMRAEWFCQTIHFEDFLKAIAATDHHWQPVTEMLKELAIGLKKSGLKKIHPEQIQKVLFLKVFKAWSSNNHRLVSPEQIWKELTWEIGLTQNRNDDELLTELNQKKHFFPPLYQRALTALSESKRKSKTKTVSILIPEKKIPVLLKTESSNPGKTGIRVRNAGLVLLNNYITTLFDRLKILSGRKFKSEDDRTDAVHYLQFAATGMCKTDESLLPLNKILCGIPLHQPIRSEITLDDNRKKLITGLVNAAIGHWPAIGNCSVDGFRGNWLVREGILIDHKEKWELIVEKKAYDVLMHKSPFSFSIIKYTWMEKPLHVTWPY
jgi:Contractile injection system tape measure protein